MQNFIAGVVGVVGVESVTFLNVTDNQTTILIQIIIGLVTITKIILTNKDKNKKNE